MVMTTRMPGEAHAYKTLVAITSGDSREFAKKVSDELRGEGFSLMRNPNAMGMPQRTRNLTFAINQAVETRAGMVVCIDCRNPDRVKDSTPERSEKGGFRPVVNVLSPQLLEATAICKDKASVKKFPGDVEQSITSIIDDLSNKEGRRIPLERINQKMEERRSEESATSHWIRRALRHMSTGKAIVEIEVFVRNEQDTPQAVDDCVTIVRRLHDFNSKKIGLADETRVLLKKPPLH